MSAFESSTLNIIPSAKLSEYTTFQLGGPCKAMIDCQTPDDVHQAVQFLSSNELPFILIGGGSNLVVSDQGLDCHVIRYVSPKPIVHIHGTQVIVSGGTILDDFAKMMVDYGLDGITFASGIPGTVGGAIVGNAGAWGRQIGDILESVVVINRHGERGILKNEDLGFTYRHSSLKDGSEIILSATFQMHRGDIPLMMKEREDILNQRREKHPDLKLFPCAGSFFRNIEPTSKAERRQAAGFFLEQAGAKDMKVGGAAVFPKHANIIIKTPGCSSQDVYELSKKMAQTVYEQFGLNLQREVRLVGPFEGSESTDVMW